MKRRPALRLLLSLAMLIATVPISAVPVPAAAEVVTTTTPTTNTDAFSALGFDTSQMPEGYDPDSTENPFGRDLLAANEVLEPFILDPGGYRLAGNNATVTAEQVASTPKAMRTVPGFALSSIESGDFDGDGLAAEMACVTFENATPPAYLQLYLVDSAGGFSEPIRLADTKFGVYGQAFFGTDFQNLLKICTGDFDGDGRSEIAVYVAQPGNARVDVYRFQQVSPGDTDWKNSTKWERVWSHAISSGAAAPNMVSLCAGDMNRDGVDDLAISYGSVEFMKPTDAVPPVLVTETDPVPSKAVVLFGSRTTMLQTRQTLPLGSEPVVRAAFAFRDVDGDTTKDLVLGAQPLDDLTANTRRVVGVYAWDGQSLQLASSDLDVVAKDNGYSTGYKSLPTMMCNVTVTTPWSPDSGGATFIYVDSVLYTYSNGAFAIAAELDDPSTFGDGRGDALRWSWVDRTVLEIPFYCEYGAASGDVEGLGTDLLMTNIAWYGVTSPGAQWPAMRVKTLFGRQDGTLGSNDIVDSQFLFSMSHAFCFPNTDKNDTVLMRYTGEHFIQYTDPKILAVLASPPYFEDVANAPDNTSYKDDMETSFGKISGTGGATITTVGFNTGAWMEQEGGIFAKAKVRLRVGFTFDWEREKTNVREYTVTFTTRGGEDAVAFFSIPQEVWVYEYLIPDGSGGYNTRRTTVTVSHQAAVQTLRLDYYESIQNDYEELPPIRGDVLEHTLGDPSTYPSSTSGYEVIDLFSPADTAPWAATSFGYGTVAQEIVFTHEVSNRYVLGASLGLEVGGGYDVFGQKGSAGWFLDFNAGGGWSDIDITGHAAGGEVKNMPVGEEQYGYHFAWRLFVAKHTIGNQSFPVVNYLVKDVTAPPTLPRDFAQVYEGTTASQIELGWSYEHQASRFDIYREFDFPQGGGSYLVGSVSAGDYRVQQDADGTWRKAYRFVDRSGLAPYSTYRYQIQVVRTKAPPESAMSAILEAKTKTSGGYPALEVSPPNVTIYPDKNAGLITTVKNIADYANGVAFYQWQKHVNGTWTDIAGATGNGLIFSAAGTGDAGAYRCRVNVLTMQNQGISAYTEPAHVGYSKRSVVLGAISALDGAGGSQMSVTVANAHSDSGAIPTGNVEFILRRRGMTGAFYGTAWLESTGRAAVSFGSLPDGLYEVTAHYSGDRIFKSGDAQPTLYLSGVGTGYWLDVPDRVTYGDTASYRLYKLSKNENWVVSREEIATLPHQILIGASETAYPGPEYDSPEPQSFYAAAAGDITLRVPYDDDGIPGPDASLDVAIGIDKRGVSLQIPAGRGGYLQAISGMEPTVTAGSLAENDQASLSSHVGYTFRNTADTIVSAADVPSTPGYYSVTGVADAALSANYKVDVSAGSYAVIGATKAVSASILPFGGQYTGTLRTVSPVEASTSGSLPLTQSLPAGTQILLSAMPDSGYVVYDWYVSGKAQHRSATTLAHTMLATDTAIAVQFIPKPSKLVFDAAGAVGGGELECLTDPDLETGAVLRQGAELTFQATPADGYHFVEWRYTVQGQGTTYPAGLTGIGGTSTFTMTMPGADVALYAVFARDSYTLTLSDHLEAFYAGDHDGDATTPDQEIVVGSGTKVVGDTILAVRPQIGYAVDQEYAWLAIGSVGEPTLDQSAYHLQITEPTEVRMPVIRQSYDLAVGLDDGGTDIEGSVTYWVTDPESSNVESGTVRTGPTGHSGTLTVDGGDMVVLEASVEDAGYLAEWAETIGSVTTTLAASRIDIGPIGEDVAVIARLGAKPVHAITLGALPEPGASYSYSLNGGPYVTASPGQSLSVIEGFSASIRVKPPTGRVVGYWVVDGATEQTFSNTRTFENVQAGHTIRPIFSSMSYCTITWPTCGATLNGVEVVPHGMSIPLLPPGLTSQFQFTVEPQLAGVTVGKVFANGTELEPDGSGIYTITPVLRNQVITMTLGDTGVKVGGTDIAAQSGDGWAYNIFTRVLALSGNGLRVSGAMLDPSVRYSMVLDPNVFAVTLDGLTLRARNVDVAVASQRIQGIAMTLLGDNLIELEHGSYRQEQSAFSAMDLAFTQNSTGTLDVVADFPAGTGDPTAVNGILARSIVMSGGKIDVTAANRVTDVSDPFEVCGIRTVGSAGVRIESGELNVESAGLGTAIGIGCEGMFIANGGLTSVSAIATAERGRAWGIAPDGGVAVNGGCVSIDVASEFPCGINTVQDWWEGQVANVSGMLEVNASAVQASPGNNVRPIPLYTPTWTLGTGMVGQSLDSVAGGFPVADPAAYLLQTRNADYFENRALSLAVDSGFAMAIPASLDLMRGDERDTGIAISRPRDSEGVPVWMNIVRLDGASILSTPGVTIDRAIDWWNPSYITLSRSFLRSLSTGVHIMVAYFQDGTSITIPISIIGAPLPNPHAVIDVHPTDGHIWKGTELGFTAELSEVTAIDDTEVTWELLSPTTSAETTLVADGSTDATMVIGLDEQAAEVQLRAHLTHYPQFESGIVTAAIDTVASAVTISPTTVSIYPKQPGGNTAQFTAHVTAVNDDPIAQDYYFELWGNTRRATRIAPIGGLLTVDPAETGYGGMLIVTVTSMTYPNPSAVATVYLNTQPFRPTTLTLTAPTTIAYGASATLSGKLSVNGGTGLGGQVVLVEKRAVDQTAWTSAGYTSTNSLGNYSKAVSLAIRTTYRVKYAGDWQYIPSSASKTVTPKAWVGNPSAPSSIRRGATLAVTGFLKPHHTAGNYPVRIYRYRYVSGVWKTYDYISAKASNYSGYTKYSLSMKFPYTGKWRVRAYHADTGHAAAWSASYDYVTVTQ